MQTGRPSEQLNVNLKDVERYCDAGLTDSQLATVLNIGLSTLYTWKNENHAMYWPEFVEAIKRGKELSDDRVERSLWERANGYEHEDEEIKVVSDGQGKGSSIERVPVIKHYPPDPLSMIFWLKNRRPEKWRDKRDIGIEGNAVRVKVTTGEGEVAEQIKNDLDEMR
jgi:hypothetical protein